MKISIMCVLCMMLVTQIPTGVAQDWMMVYDPAENPDPSGWTGGPRIDNYRHVPLSIWNNFNSLFVHYGHPEWISRAPEWVRSPYWYQYPMYSVRYPY